MGYKTNHETGLSKIHQDRVLFLGEALKSKLERSHTYINDDLIKKVSEVTITEVEETLANERDPNVMSPTFKIRKELGPENLYRWIALGIGRSLDIDLRIKNREITLLTLARKAYRAAEYKKEWNPNYFPK